MAGPRIAPAQAASSQAPAGGADLHEELCTASAREGFLLSGGVDIDAAAEAFGPHVARYDQWLADGKAAEMAYLVRGRDRRADPRLVFAPAQSVFSVAIPYPRHPAAERGPRYARYLRGPDYHLDLAARLDRAIASVSEARAARGEPPLQWKTCVDSSAVLERSWAALAGLGWIGKNTLLIHPRHGSYLFLAEALIDQRLDRGPRPLPNLCGGCTRCLRACPTQAFDGPGSLDSRRCVSYLTLEHRSGLPDRPAPAAAGWVAGCDICQEVCPFNLKPARLPDGPIEPAADATRVNEWLALLNESEDAYRARVKGSALKRVKPWMFRRNLARALTDAIARGEVEPSDELRSAIKRRASVETEPLAAREWERCQRAMPKVGEGIGDDC